MVGGLVCRGQWLWGQGVPDAQAEAMGVQAEKRTCRPQADPGLIGVSVPGRVKGYNFAPHKAPT